MPLDNQILATCEIVKSVANRGHQQIPFPEFSDNLNGKNMDSAYAEITSWPGYVPTPLISLDKLATHCGVRSVVYKDESQRLDMKSFKALGGAYAVANLVTKLGASGLNRKASL